MVMTDRLTTFAMGRIGADATDLDTGSLSDTVYGSINNISGGELLMGSYESQGPQGPDMRWNGSFSLSNFTFDVLQASERPEDLAGEEVFFEIINNWNRSATPSAATSRKVRVAGLITSFGSGTLQRPIDDYPRTIEMIVWQLIIGGGATQDVMSKTGARLWADTRVGELYRDGVDLYANYRTLHGVASG